MGDFLGVDIAELVNQDFAPVVNDATLTVVTAGVRTPGSLTGGTNPTEADHSCKGFSRKHTAEEMKNSLVETGDRVIVLIANTLTVTPRTKDKVTIGGVEYEIVSVDGDAAGATFIIHGRGIA